jgi:hypothetical protein
MISRCANPDCHAPFDAHCGRFFRFHRPHAPNEKPANHHSVCHFWLCQECSKIYTLENRGKGVQICRRLSHSNREGVLQKIASIAR